MKTKDRKIAELRAAEYNPRRLTDKQYKELRRSMEDLGVLAPAVVNTYPGRENVIIAGHQRIRIARDLGHATYPCWEVSFDPEKEREANIRLNKAGGEWDFDILANEFEIGNLLDLGFTEKELRIGVETDAERHEPEEVEIQAFRQTHVLISFPPERLLEIQDHLDAIRDMDGVEVEISSN